MNTTPSPAIEAVEAPHAALISRLRHSACITTSVILGDTLDKAANAISEQSALLAAKQEELERTERNRDMWKEQCAAQATTLTGRQEELDKMRADAERYRFLQQATESQVWQLFDRAETDEHLNAMIDAARAAAQSTKGA